MTDDWPAVGARLALRYRLIAPIEQGGMAVVWRAHDELLGRPVALKLLAGTVAERPDGFQLVRREARAGARLSHPNVTAVHDYAEAVRPDGAVAPFVVMELLDGETLAARLARGTLRWREAAAIGAPVADALAAAHGSGVVHRDVTPGNVMLTHAGIKVLDFGISAAVGEPDEDSNGSTFGTPAYVAPERLDGLPALPATDVYALGCLLFEMVSGQPPYQVDTWEELAVARTRPPGDLPPGLSAGYVRLVRRCLSADPDERPAAAEAAEILHDLASGMSSAPHAVRVRRSPDTGPGRRRRRNTVIRQAGLLVFTLGALTAGAIAVSGPSDLAEPPVAAPAGPPGGALLPDSGSRSTGEPVPLRSRPLIESTGAASRSADRDAGAATPTAGTDEPAPYEGPGSGPATPAPGAGAGSPSPGPTSPAAGPTTPSPGPENAILQMRSAIDAGVQAGEVRPDAGTDLLNVLDTMRGGAAPDLGHKVAHLRAKIEERTREGAITGSRARVLHLRLTELSQVASV